MVFLLPSDSFVQLEKGSPQNHTLYPVRMSYVIGGGLQLIDSHLVEPSQVELICGASDIKMNKLNEYRQDFV